MNSKYAVVQFYPDPGSDERLDIGVVAWDAAGAHVVFIESWERTHAIGLEEAQRLQDFADLLRAQAPDDVELLIDPVTGALARHLALAAAPGIRLSPVKSAPQDAPALAASLAAQFHYGPPPRPKRGRDRRSAAHCAYRAVFGAVRRRAPNFAARLVHARQVVDGKFGKHQFDVVLAGAHPLAAIEALSFEVGSPRSLRRDVDATAWALDDVHKLHPRLPLAVFALPPANPDAKSVQGDAARLFRGLGASVISTEPSMARWALRHAGPLSASQPSPP